jgi:hypothetical protein
MTSRALVLRSHRQKARAELPAEALLEIQLLEGAGVEGKKAL